MKRPLDTCPRNHVIAARSFVYRAFTWCSVSRRPVCHSPWEHKKLISPSTVAARGQDNKDALLTGKYLPVSTSKEAMYPVHVCPSCIV